MDPGFRRGDEWGAPAEPLDPAGERFAGDTGSIVGEIGRPVGAVADIDLAESSRLVAARLAIGVADDLELLLERAEGVVAAPGAVIVVVGIEIILLALEVAAIDRLAFARFDMPPAFGDPVAVLLVAEGRIHRR